MLEISFEQLLPIPVFAIATEIPAVTIRSMSKYFHQRGPRLTSFPCNNNLGASGVFIKTKPATSAVFAASITLLTHAFRDITLRSGDTTSRIPEAAMSARLVKSTAPPTVVPSTSGMLADP